MQPHMLETSGCSHNFLFLRRFKKLNLHTDSTAGPGYQTRSPLI